MYNECAKLYDSPLRDQFSRQCFKVCVKVLKGRAIFPPAPVVDLGSGTGLLSRLLSEEGFSVTGVDLSERMMEIARNRCISLDPHPEFVVDDIRCFRRREAFRGAFCFGDVLNHLLLPADLAQLFSSVFYSLAPGGVFLADTTTLEAYRSDLWRARGLSEERDGLKVTISSDFEVESDLGWIEVRAQSGDSVTIERMEQRYHPRELIASLLKDAGFRDVVWQGFDPLPELAKCGTIKNCWMGIKPIAG